MSEAPTYRSGADSIPAHSSGADAEQRAAALEFLQNLAQDVSNGNVDLPCFPEVVGRISQALADPDTTAARMVVLVGAEPRLAARVLQTANSAAYNLNGKPLADLQSAITRLGYASVQSIAMSYAMQRLGDDARLRCIREPLTQLWDRSMLVAALARRVALRTRLGTEEAFLAGLMHGIGSLYIMVRSTNGVDNCSSVMTWVDLIGGWMAPIGKAVLENWGFSEALCEAVATQADLGRKWRHEAELGDVLIVSNVLLDASRSGDLTQFSVRGIGAFSTLGIRGEECAAIFDEATRDVVGVRDVLGVV